MSFETSKNIILTTTEYKDLESYCKLNDYDMDKVVKDSYLQGFRIEKYGLLSDISGRKTEPEIKEVIIEKPIIEYVDREVIKEIIKEIPVEKTIEIIKEIPVEKVVEKTVEIIKEVPVDRVVIQEVIKEVPIEKIVTRTEYITDESKVAELVEELERLRTLPPTIVDREVIKEVQVPVEVIREVEVVKEIIVEKQSDQVLRLQETLSKIRSQIIEKDLKINELTEELTKLVSFQNEQKALYLRGSNLDDKLYK